MSADELSFELRVTVLQEHGDDLLEVAQEVVDGGALGVGAGPPWDVADVEAGVTVAFDDCCVGSHRRGCGLE